jgi:hypothetical protein
MNSETITPLDDGRIQAATEFVPMLRDSQLDSFAAVMSKEVPSPVRVFPGRVTVRLELKSRSGAARAVYLKRYERKYVSPWRFFLRAIHWPTAEDEALREWRHLWKLRAEGFNTPVPVAFGQEKYLGVTVRSFLMTEEIRDGIQGDYYCRDAEARERRQLAVEAADLTRKFHGAGFVHKDYYLCHIFVVPRSGSGQLVLLDLQRLVRPRFFRERWLVKDLGALAYSALKFGASHADLMRFFKRYRNKPRLDSSDRRLARKVLARVDWLSKRRPRHDQVFTQLKR